MAKTVNLTINVDDSKFREFTQKFERLSEQMNDLNEKFKKIAAPLEKATKAAQTLTAALNRASISMRELSKWGEGITRSMTKWTALIGSVTMMLGTGAGLFGIERLSRTLMQKRREQMGVGTEWGKMQAASVGASSILNDPQKVMQQIAIEQKGGGPDFGTRLFRIGVPGLDKMDPADAMIKMMERAVKLGEIAREKGGRPMATTEGEELSRYLGETGTAALMGKEGRKELERIKKWIQDNQKAGLEPRDAEKWAALYQAAQGFVNQIQTSLGTALSGIAGSLTQVSNKFGELVKALMESPAIKQALENLRKWLDEFADTLGSDETKEKMNQWMKAMGDIDWTTLGETIKEFVSAMGSAINFLLDFISKKNTAGYILLSTPRELAKDAWEKLFGKGDWEKAFGSNFKERFGDWTKGPAGTGPQNLAPLVMPPGTPALPGLPAMPSQPGSVPPGAPPRTGGTGTPPPVPGAPGWLPGGRGWVPPTFPSGNPFAPPTPGSQGAISMPTQFASASPAMQLASAVGGGGGGAPFFSSHTTNNNIASWGSAAKSAVPKNTGSIFTKLAANMENNFFGAPGGGGRGRGGLDINNWQLNRTATLRVDNVTGNNLSLIGQSLG